MDPDPDGLQIALQLLLLVALTLINAFFASAEMAVVSVNKSKIQTLAAKGNTNAKRVQTLFDDSTAFLSTIQVAITFAGFFSSASAATGISQVLSGALSNWGIPASWSQPVAVIAVTLILSYITLVFGELVPKRIALQKAEETSMRSVRPILMVSKVLRPFIWLLSVSTNGVLRLFGMKPDAPEEAVTEEDIRAQLIAARFDDHSRRMIDSVFTFDDKTARDVMVPRRKVAALDAKRPFEESAERILQSGFSRIPVYEGEIDRIVGVLSVKDLARAIIKGDQPDVKALMREPYFVPDSKPANVLLQEMQKERAHLAVLIDEYGGFSGIVTIEDLTEEIVGDIRDENDHTFPDFEPQPDGSILVSGGMTLFELCEKLDVEEPDSNCDTLSGYVLEQLGYIPTEQQHNTINLLGRDCRLEQMDGRQIARVRFLPNTEKAAEPIP